MIFCRFLKLVLWRESEPPPSIIWRRRKILFIIMNVFLIPILMSYGICVLYVMMWLVVHPLDGHPPRSWLAVSALPTFFAQIMRQIQPNYPFVLILFLLIRKEGSSLWWISKWCRNLCKSYILTIGYLAWCDLLGWLLEDNNVVLGYAWCGFLLWVVMLTDSFVWEFCVCR